VHGSEICRVQTAVPLYWKFPDCWASRQTEVPTNRIASHVNIMPTILELLHVTNRVCTGESIFHSPCDSAVIVQQNGDDDPTEFVIQSRAFKGWFQFPSESTIIQFEDTLKLTRLTDPFDHELFTENLNYVLRQEFGRELKRLFPGFTVVPNK
jgi:hypothetical protein